MWSYSYYLIGSVKIHENSRAHRDAWAILEQQKHLAMRGGMQTVLYPEDAIYAAVSLVCPAIFLARLLYRILKIAICILL